MISYFFNLYYQNIWVKRVYNYFRSQFLIPPQAGRRGRARVPRRHLLPLPRPVPHPGVPRLERLSLEPPRRSPAHARTPANRERPLPCSRAGEGWPTPPSTRAPPTDVHRALPSVALRLPPNASRVSFRYRSRSSRARREFRSWQSSSWTAWYARAPGSVVGPPPPV